MSKELAVVNRSLAFADLVTAWEDFILSRQAMRCTETTLSWYRFTAGEFLLWCERQGVTRPSEIDVRLVRAYLAELDDKGKADKTLHAHARAIRTLLRFFCAEKYIPEPITFAMPKMEAKRLPSLTASQLETVLAACKTPREKALIMLLADSGLRRAEVSLLNWNDLDMQTGLLRVKRGKGGKARSAVISPTTRQSLLKYRRTLEKKAEDAPMFQGRTGKRLLGTGIRKTIGKISQRAGIFFTAHALRRTFVLLSLRSGASPLHLQAQGGWSSLEMVSRYAQLNDIDLIQNSREHSPIESLRS